MVKIIVTHLNPDLDAICSVWLLKKFDPDFSDAKVRFVPAGLTFKGGKVDSDVDVVHVDTGMGKFDHHQLEQKTCAAKLIFRHLKKKRKYLKDDEALVRLINIVKKIDNFEEVTWPHPTADWYDFLLPEVLNGLKTAGIVKDKGLVEKGIECLEAVYNTLKIKVKAEEDLSQGYRFSTKWGKAIGCLSHNSEVLKLGQKMGYVIAVQKDSKTEHVRIKARPDSKADLTEAKKVLQKLDPKATWFLHISKKMLLNGSSKNKKMKPSSLSLVKVIEVLEEL
jgi:hypothetical protein